MATARERFARRGIARIGIARLGIALGCTFVLVACAASKPAASQKEADPPSPAVDPSAWLGEIVRSCARVASCAHPHDAPRFGDATACADWWLTHLPGERDALHACLLAAKSCDAVDACTHEHGDARAIAFCDAHHGLISGCDANRLVTCSGDDIGESTALDCTTLSAKCGETSMPGGLVVRGCFSPSLCPSNAPPERCENTQAMLSCHDGAAERFPCREGTRCEEHVEADGDRAASCEPIIHARCEVPGARACSGDRLIVCEPSGHFGDVRTTDCGSLGMRCAGQGANAGCVRPHPDCDPGPARCDGEAITFCAAGTRARVSCASIGLGPCDPDGHGAQAACRTAAPITK